ncbi:MAG: hypothetical protein JNL67_18375 [Planctomycetaceae bacterium]|nr:hypothetical protein [Planctomycetaceae bacterium]
MNFAPSHYRKAIYGILAAILLLPISFLARPNQVSKDPTMAGEATGGTISQMRSKHNLSQASLSSIDPTSEVMKLASLGLHGIAVNVLWNQANQFQEKKAFDKVSSTVDTLILLQPNFVSVWEFQGHNLAYNISREFDDYQDRYFWVKEGLNFFTKGIAFNKRDHRIFDNLGLHTGLKLGGSDEKKQFRQMLRKDREYVDTFVSKFINPDRFDKPEAGGFDSWMLSYWWYDKSYHMRENLGVPKRTSDLMYWVKGPQQLRQYAEALSVDFRPGEATQKAWRTAYEAWTDRDRVGERQGFGKRDIMTSFGIEIRLEDLERELERQRAISRRMDELVPGVREELYQQRVAKLSPDDQRILKMPADQRQFKDIGEMVRIEAMLLIYEYEIAERASPENRVAAQNLLRELADGEFRRNQMDSYRYTVNYNYWRDFTNMESTVPAVLARQAAYEAAELDRQGILESFEEQVTDENGVTTTVKRDGSIDALWRYFQHTSEAVKPFPGLHDGESTFIEDLMVDFTKFGGHLRDVGREWPDDFPMQWFIDERVRRYGRANIKNLMTTEDIEARKRERGLLEEQTEQPEQTKPAEQTDQAVQADQSGQGDQ